MTSSTAKFPVIGLRPTVVKMTACMASLGQEIPDTRTSNRRPTISVMGRHKCNKTCNKTYNNS